MVSGYVTVDLGRLRDDVFYVRAGDITCNRPDTWYFRGTRQQAIEHWLGLLECRGSSWPFPELILCSHYGLLENVPDQDGYGADLLTEELAADSTAATLDFKHDLTQEEMNWLAVKLEAEGCAWPRLAVHGDPHASAAWGERVRTWEDGI
jgi:hypothetical protein